MSMMQTLVLNQLVHNADYFGKVLPHLKKDYFDTEPSRILFATIDSFAQEYNNQPTPDALAIIVNDLKISEGIWDGVIDLMGEIEKPVVGQNYDWLIKETEKWMRDRAVYNVITDSVDIYSNPTRRGELGEIPSRMEEALVVGFDDDLGMIYWEMAGEQYDYMHTDVNRIPFTVDILNKITNGGVWRKSLSAINAGINVGKSTSLIDLAAQYASQGLNVVYFTFEVTEKRIRHRMDCRVLERDFETVEALDRHQYVASIEQKFNTKTYGQIFIKEFDSGAGHAGHCRAYVKDLIKRRGIVPDIMLFDYVGEMASERLPFAMMSKSDLYYGSIARELRSLVFQFNAVGWTALQFQRGMQNTKEMSLDGNADSITVPKVLDFQLGLAIPDEYAQLNQAWGTVLKNRFANKAKMKNFIIGLNNDKQMLYDVDAKMQTFSAGELNQGPRPDTNNLNTPLEEGVGTAPLTSLRRASKSTVTDGDASQLKF